MTEGAGFADVRSQTMNQFRDFAKLVAAIDSYGMQSGIVKVVPPPEWYVVVDLPLPGAQPRLRTQFRTTQHNPVPPIITRHRAHHQQTSHDTAATHH